MAAIKQEDFIQSIADAFQYISYYHPLDYIKALGEAYKREESPAAKDAIAQILTNSRMAAEGHRPICQDTGIAVVFLKVGQNLKWDATMSVQEMVNEGVRRAYLNPDNTLRASVLLDPAAPARTPKTTRQPLFTTKSLKATSSKSSVPLKGVALKTRPSSTPSIHRTRLLTGFSKPYRPWAPAGAHLAFWASALAAPQKKPCCRLKNR